MRAYSDWRSLGLTSRAELLLFWQTTTLSTAVLVLERHVAVTYTLHPTAVAAYPMAFRLHTWGQLQVQGWCRAENCGSRPQHFVLLSVRLTALALYLWAIGWWTAKEGWL